MGTGWDIPQDLQRIDDVFALERDLSSVPYRLDLVAFQLARQAYFVKFQTFDALTDR